VLGRFSQISHRLVSRGQIQTNLIGQLTDLDLRIRTPGDSPDARHETTDQKAGPPNDHAPTYAWNESWNRSPENPGALGAVTALSRGIGAGSADEARERASRNASLRLSASLRHRPYQDHLLMEASGALDFDARRLEPTMLNASSDISGRSQTARELGIRLRTAEIGFSESTSARASAAPGRSTSARASAAS
jgi:hypothetical protein